MENLLSYIEFTQFQEMAMDELENPDNADPELVSMIRLPPNIPLSAILEVKAPGFNSRESPNRQQKKLELKLKAHYLYNKYIKVGSEFEINISGMQRDLIANMLDNLDDLLQNDNIRIDDIFEQFEECKMEMFALLKTSLDRYKYDASFEELVREFNISSGHIRSNSKTSFTSNATTISLKYVD